MSLPKPSTSQRSVVIEHTTDKMEKDNKVSTEMEGTRAKLREKLREKLLEEEKISAVEAHIENQPDEEENEEDENKPDEQQINIMLKPIYVVLGERKSNPRTNEQVALNEDHYGLLKRRKMETQQLLVQAMEQEKETESGKDILDDPESRDSDEDINEEKQQWKVRELKRLIRDKTERNRKQKEREEIKRRRKLTDAQRSIEDKLSGKTSEMTVEKPKMQFLQKYTPKAPFYQDLPEYASKQNHHVPVQEDLQDKSFLPTVMQKRRGEFGRSGQSKYTHLKKEDTSNLDPKCRVDEGIRGNIRDRQGGFKGSNILERPSSRKHV